MRENKIIDWVYTGLLVAAVGSVACRPARADSGIASQEITRATPPPSTQTGTVEPVSSPTLVPIPEISATPTTLKELTSTPFPTPAALTTPTPEKTPTPKFDSAEATITSAYEGLIQEAILDPDVNPTNPKVREYLSEIQKNPERASIIQVTIEAKYQPILAVLQTRRAQTQTAAIVPPPTPSETRVPTQPPRTPTPIPAKPQPTSTPRFTIVSSSQYSTEVADTQTKVARASSMSREQYDARASAIQTELAAYNTKQALQNPNIRRDLQCVASCTQVPVTPTSTDTPRPSMSIKDYVESELKPSSIESTYRLPLLPTPDSRVVSNPQFIARKTALTHFRELLDSTEEQILMGARSGWFVNRKIYAAPFMGNSVVSPEMQLLVSLQPDQDLFKVRIARYYGQGIVGGQGLMEGYDIELKDLKVSLESDLRIESADRANGISFKGAAKISFIRRFKAQRTPVNRIPNLSAINFEPWQGVSRILNVSNTNGRWSATRLPDSYNDYWFEPVMLPYSR